MAHNEGEWLTQTEQDKILAERKENWSGFKEPANLDEYLELLKKSGQDISSKTREEWEAEYRKVVAYRKNVKKL